MSHMSPMGSQSPCRTTNNQKKQKKTKKNKRTITTITRSTTSPCRTAAAAVCGDPPSTCGRTAAPGSCRSHQSRRCWQSQHSHSTVTSPHSHRTVTVAIATTTPRTYIHRTVAVTFTVIATATATVTGTAQPQPHHGRQLPLTSRAAVPRRPGCLAAYRGAETPRRGRGPEDMHAAIVTSDCKHQSTSDKHRHFFGGFLGGECKNTARVGRGTHG